LARLKSGVRCSARFRPGLGQLRVKGSGLPRNQLSGLEVRSTPASGPARAEAARLFRAKSGREQVQHTNALLDDRVGEREQLVWNIEAYRLRGLDIDDQLELGRLFNRQIGRFCPSRYPINVFGH
jgi:hypothetical protein